MAPNKNSRPAPVAPTTTTVHHVPDKLLRLIFERLGWPLWFVRAAATCRRWRRIVVQVIIPRRRLLHPLVVGSYRNNRDAPARGPIFTPSPLAVAAVDRRHFSLDFLPGGGGQWELLDSSRSVLLLAKRKTGWMRRCFPDLVLCEPATRRYQLIPRMEEMKHERYFGAFLYGHGAINVGSWEEKSYNRSTFEVVCLLYQRHDRVCEEIGRARVCVFYYYTHCGRLVLNRPPGWYLKKEYHGQSSPDLRGPESLYFLGRTTHFPYWGIRHDDRALLLFDGYTEVYSVPDVARGSVFRLVDHSSQYDKIRVVCLHGSTLRIFVALFYNMENSVLEKSIQLTEATSGLVGYKEEYFGGGSDALEIVAADKGSVVVAAATKAWMFSVDLETMEVAEYKCKKNADISVVAYPCELPWPLTLNACKVRCK
ncbi:hypothetical protein VPH35_071901 [Triticum aestivum]|uniref:F-box domain-containing protein n=3 Tax=Triticum TaxID=4564 RepID=A0A9R0W8L1_TRITD|nr:unnamed protein product [Triticum turgidum subsp. durum]